MKRRPSFSRTPLGCGIALACGSLPAAALAAVAGRVDFTVGDVTATARDGQVRALRKGADIREGDTIDTGAGRAWIRFTDGAYMSLQPQTVFRVDEYRYEGEEDGSEKGFFSMLKGGLRTITGVIGRQNRSNYRVNTPVATIGIRGTEYLAVLGESLTVTCGRGVCVVTNEAGEVVLESGQTVYLEDQSARPERRTRKPVLPPAPPVEFRGPEDRDSGGDPAIVEVPPPEEPVEPPEPPPEPGQLLPDGPGYALAASFGGDGGETIGTIVEPSVSADFDADSRLEEYVASFGARGTASFADTGADAIIGWGRWTGGVTDGDTFPHPIDLTQGNQSFHYVVGVPTEELPTTIIATYELLGATTPTFSDDGFAGGVDFGDPVSVTGSLVADFTQSQLDTSLLLEFTKNELDITANNIPIGTSNGPAFFSGGGAVAFDNLGICSGGCSTTIAGFFAGANAERAGYAYDVFIPSYPSSYVINGAVTFKQTEAIIE